jgi:hypothetical protein
MAETYAILVEGLSTLKSLDDLDDSIKLSAVRAINKIARDGRAAASREIRKQVAFPPAYVSPSQGRLAVTRQATRSSLEAAIGARARSTSLARFATNKGGPGGVSVVVKPGKATAIRRAFLIRLRAGTANLDTKSNLGLAIRLRPGETLRNKYAAKRMQNGLYLLYGPSVDQVFLNNAGKGVAADLEPEVLEKLEAEFVRQLGL